MLCRQVCHGTLGMSTLMVLLILTGKNCLFYIFTTWGVLVTARKRSFGQGNIFIGVCQEFCSQGGVCSGGSAPGWWSALGGGVYSEGVPGPSRCLVPGGVCSRGVSAPRGFLVETPPTGRLLLRTVHILLECILVLVNFSPECAETGCLGATESEVWIGNFNVKAWKTTEHKLHKIWCSLKVCKIMARAIRNALRPVQEPNQGFKCKIIRNITSNDRSFHCPIISTDIYIHNAILFIDTSNNAWYNQAHWLVGAPSIIDNC